MKSLKFTPWIPKKHAKLIVSDNLEEIITKIAGSAAGTHVDLPPVRFFDFLGEVLLEEDSPCNCRRRGCPALRSHLRLVK